MKIVYTKPVRARIAEIQAHRARETSEEHAAKLIWGLLDKADKLLTNPLLGAPEPAMAFLGKGHRCLLAGRFKIVYYIHGEEVRITDFFDTKQHPDRMRG
jgi:toxin ParE1/3/4